MIRSLVSLLALITGIIFLSGCKNKNPLMYDPQEVITTTAKDSLYFSIKDFFDDQWKHESHQPYTLVKVVKEGNQTDSSYVQWQQVFKEFRKVFDSSDICSPRFLNKYKFSTSQEPSLGIQNLEYDATDPNVFTRKLVIGMDMMSNRILSIYVETKIDKTSNYQTQKLTYIPLRVIQIQQFKKGFWVSGKETVTTYKFPESNREEESI